MRALLKRITLAGLMALAAVCGSTQAQDALVDFPTTNLSIGINLIKAEVATNDPQREQGLMFRRELASNAGMVFLFDQKSRQCMWMKNTYLPLSVAFMDETGSILNIEDMQPQTLDSHCSKGPASYALEMNLGWFAKHGIKAGQSIKGLPPTR